MSDIELIQQQLSHVIWASFAVIIVLILLSGYFSLDISRWIMKLFKKSNVRKHELRNILSAINEGIIVITFDENVKLCSKNFLEFLSDTEYKNKLYWQIIKNTELADIIKNVLKHHTNIQQEIRLEQRIYLLRSVVLKDKEEIIFILFDITETRKIKKIKKNLIANVSHELRTPLTSIKGFVETLEEDISDEQRIYTDIIKRNTDRIISIVTDLLTLSEAEHEHMLGDIHLINAEKFFNNICILFEKKAQNKGLELILDNNIKRFSADGFKFEQVMINLVDNAIKYTECGSVEIITQESSEKTIIRVKDTGIGISEKYYERIFERFYVVDKSRSRQSGGTGLGLSIVKHIVELHNGSISVKSDSSSGTEFIVSLPKY